MTTNVICLWYAGTAEEAAQFYAQTFPDSTVTAIHRMRIGGGFKFRVF